MVGVESPSFVFNSYVKHDIIIIVIMIIKYCLLLHQ